MKYLFERWIAKATANLTKWAWYTSSPYITVLFCLQLQLISREVMRKSAKDSKKSFFISSIAHGIFKSFSHLHYAHLFNFQNNVFCELYFPLIKALFWIVYNASTASRNKPYAPMNPWPLDCATRCIGVEINYMCLI